MCLIYNSINYRRNVVGLEAVAGNPNAIVLFSRSSRCRHQRRCVFVMVGERREDGGVLEKQSRQNMSIF